MKRSLRGLEEIVGNLKKNIKTKDNTSLPALAVKALQHQLHILYKILTFISYIFI